MLGRLLNTAASFARSGGAAGGARRGGYGTTGRRRPATGRPTRGGGMAGGLAGAVQGFLRGSGRRY